MVKGDRLITAPTLLLLLLPLTDSVRGIKGRRVNLLVWLAGAGASLHLLHAAI